jgi:hypothetical protein
MVAFATRIDQPEVTPNSYFTDGSGLFRIVSTQSPDTDSWVELENCMTLEVRWYTHAQVMAMGLRAVCLAEAADPAEPTTT